MSSATGSRRIPERKIVTVLFADLCGSLELIRKRDPEVAHALFDDVVFILREAAHRFGGTVTEILGDGILALFGAPQAFEDHADRAALAGLAMVDGIERYARTGDASHARVAIRVGLASGEVVLDDRRSDTGLTYAASGETAHLASRLERLAEVNGICAAGATVELLTHGFVLEPRRSVAIAGFDTPVDVHAIKGVERTLDRLQARLARGTTPFVNRVREIARLHRATKAVLGGERAFVRIAGGAGLGKSRLLAELRRQLAASGWTTLDLKAARPFQAESLRSVADLVRDALGLRPGAGRKRLATALEGLGVGEVELEPLATLLGAPARDDRWQNLPAEERALRVTGAVAEVLRRLGARAPLLVTIEDKHAADAATTAFVADLTQRLAGARVAIVTTTRPESVSNHANASSVLRLRPLQPPCARTLLDHLLGHGPELDPLKVLLVERTGGEPFFLEEIVRELKASNALRPVGDGSWNLAAPLERLPIPANVRATLEARIDRLPADDRETLRGCAIVGDDIDPALVSAATGLPLSRTLARLANLVTNDLLARQPDQAALGSRLAFRHGLIRETVLQSLLSSRQTELHRRVVAAIDADPAWAGRADRDAVLAHHCYRSRSFERAAGHFVALAEAALSRSVPAAADEAARRGLAALDELGPTGRAHPLRTTMLLLAGDAAFARGDRALFGNRVAAAVTLAEQRGEDTTLVRALSSQCLHAWMEGRLRDAVATAERCHALALRSGDLALRISTGVRFGVMLQARGHYARSLDLLERALARVPANAPLERFGMPSIPALACRASMARSFAEVARFEDARKLGAEAVTMARAAQHGFSFCYVAREVGLALIRTGDPAAAVPLLDEGLETAEARGATVLIPALQSALGHALVSTGQPQRGLDLLVEARAASVAHDTPVRMSQIMGWLADAQWRLGQEADARATALAALDWARRCDEIGHEGWVLLTLARLDATLPDGAEPLDVALRTARNEGLTTLERACIEMAVAARKDPAAVA